MNLRNFLVSRVTPVFLAARSLGEVFTTVEAPRWLSILPARAAVPFLILFRLRFRD